MYMHMYLHAYVERLHHQATEVNCKDMGTSCVSLDLPNYRPACLHLYSRGSRYVPSNGYLANIISIPPKNIQCIHDIGTWTLRVHAIRTCSLSPITGIPHWGLRFIRTYSKLRELPLLLQTWGIWIVNMRGSGLVLLPVKHTSKLICAC